MNAGIFVAISMFALAVAAITLAAGWSDAKGREKRANDAADLWQTKAQREEARADFWRTEAESGRCPYHSRRTK